MDYLIPQNTESPYIIYLIPPPTHTWRPQLGLCRYFALTEQQDLFNLYPFALYWLTLFVQL